MNTNGKESTTQSDDVQGHGSINVNETVDSDDDDVQGHGSLNVNETVDSDDDR